MKQTYIRCPRCELNYILKKDKYCNVCKTEMRALGTFGSEDDIDLELCPVCKVNYINPNEDMCSTCAKEKAANEDDYDEKGSSPWSPYATPEDDDAGYSDEETSDMVSITNLDDGTLETDDEITLGLAEDDEAVVVDDVEDEEDDEDDEESVDDKDEYEDDFDDEEEDEKPKRKKK